ncbi:MAG: hypothetical protein LUE26_12095 [Alistipes sp.]|nr:hypothetical protein [Alistipes sp.]
MLELYEGVGGYFLAGHRSGISHGGATIQAGIRYRGRTLLRNKIYMDYSAGYHHYFGNTRLNHVNLLSINFYLKRRIAMSGGNSDLSGRGNFLDRPLMTF